MKRKILALLIGVGILCLLLTSLLVRYTTNLLDTTSTGEERVNRNDILKNAQSFLEDGQEKALINSLKKYGISLVLYDTAGSILYDSKDSERNGQKEDINKVIEEASGSKQILTVNYIADQSQQLAIAILEDKVNPLAKQVGIKKIKEAIWALCAVFLSLLISILLIIYWKVLYPFRKLERFASEIAKGNLEAPMVYPRQNIFGAFTWGFDMLRNELKITKERGEEAERTKKELVAVLSHDIRTPIASIKAYAECLGGLPDKNSERSERYLSVIIQKADELAKLSQDMFLHAISDLEKLEVVPTVLKSRELLNNILEPLILQYENRIIISSEVVDTSVYADQARLSQVCDNILSNAAKYAPGSVIQIDTKLSEDMLLCQFRDHGVGVIPEDLPFILDKFYRGKNAKESGQEGSGLGLYICNHILEKMGGRMRVYNHQEDGNSGFVVEIALKIQ